MERILYSAGMSNSLLPEAVRTSPSDALKLNLWAGVAVIVSFLSRGWLAHHADWKAVLRAGVALAPIVPSLLWARSIAHWMRNLDELQRRIQYEAWFFAAVGTVFVETALNLVGAAGALRLERMQHGLGWEGAFALMFLLYCVGAAISNRRYR
jgi:hypothetical protein